jgi:hypothetical protein
VSRGGYGIEYTCVVHKDTFQLGYRLHSNYDCTGTLLSEDVASEKLDKCATDDIADNGPLSVGYMCQPDSDAFNKKSSIIIR